MTNSQTYEGQYTSDDFLFWFDPKNDGIKSRPSYSIYVLAMSGHSKQDYTPVAGNFRSAETALRAMGHMLAQGVIDLSQAPRVEPTVMTSFGSIVANVRFA